MDDRIRKIIDSISNQIVSIPKITEDKKNYKEFLEKYYDYLRQGFEVKELRTCKVYFRFSDDENALVESLELRRFVTNLIFWEPLVKFGMGNTLDRERIVDCTRLTTDLIKDFIDKYIITPCKKHISNKKLNIAIHDLIFNLTKISTDFNSLLAMSINVETFINLANRNPRFNEIIRTKIDPSMQPNEVEAHLDAIMHEEINILKHEDNSLKPILNSGTGIKDKQLLEFSVNGGLKPDLNDNTIPIPINANFVVGGLSNVSNYYLDSLNKLGAA